MSFSAAGRSIDSIKSIEVWWTRLRLGFIESLFLRLGGNNIDEGNGWESKSGICKLSGKSSKPCESLCVWHVAKMSISLFRLWRNIVGNEITSVLVIRSHIAGECTGVLHSDVSLQNDESYVSKVSALNILFKGIEGNDAMSENDIHSWVSLCCWTGVW